MKRLFDVVAAGAGLLAASPLLLLISLAVRLDSPGPAFFRQVRVGRHGVPFEILKFRTMRCALPGAESGPLITVDSDDRITRLGRMLRRSKLDELPQLINVVRGDMSIVGPRPEVPRYVALYPEEARREILSIRPGITDEASIEFRQESALLASADDPERTYVERIMPAKIEHYRRYVRERTLLGDVRIVLRTLRKIV
jgi:lipopolysaccharide/colanic/teichoic acid biosynthesis glycosyltransferase